MSKAFLRDLRKTPNLLSIFRFLLIPVFIWFFSKERMAETLAVLCVSFATDVADGYVARKFGLETELGKILDPAADKATQVAIIFTLWSNGYVSVLFFVLIFAKEASMAVGAVYLKKRIKSDIISANKWGKIATCAFYVSSALLIVNAPYNIGLIAMSVTMLLMAIAFSTYSREVLKLRKSVR